MERIADFRAPWGRPLWIVTALGTVVLFGCAAVGGVSAVTSPPQPLWLWLCAMVVVPLVIWLGGLAFVIRDYTLCDGAVLVGRLGWHSQIDLEGLRSVEVDPQAMGRSLRQCGNGGLFCFAGLFRNKRLGSYRAFATDLSRAVVLRYGKGRTVVVTPDNPERFAELVGFFVDKPEEPNTPTSCATSEPVGDPAT